VLAANLSKANVIWGHLAIAFGCLPAYLYAGEGFKYLVAPYVIYMVVSKNGAYFPALLFHFLFGSTISFVILLSCASLAIFHFRLWFQVRLGLIFLMSIIPLPFFVFQTYQRGLGLGSGLVESLIPLSYYIGLFPFFYGVLVYRSIDSRIMECVYALLGGVTIVQLWMLSDYSIRYYFYALPAIMALLLYVYVKRQAKAIPFYVCALAVLAGLSFILNLAGMTFTLLLSTLLAMVISALIVKSRIRQFLYSKWMFLGGTMLVALTINYGSSLTSIPSGKSFELNSQIDITDFSQWKDRLVFKIFEDRVPVWTGAWNQIVGENLLLPPLHVKQFEMKSQGGGKIDIDFGAHNLFLELLRNYGFVFGLLLSLVFILMITKSTALLNVGSRDVYFVVGSATVFSVGIIGSMFGQFPLVVTFSFLLMSLAGICYGRYLQIYFWRAR